MTRDSWRTPISGPLGKGWPDLVMVREKDRRLIFVELKLDGAKTSPDQDRVLDMLAALREDGVEASCGNHKSAADAMAHRCKECPLWLQVSVWRPVHWPEIEKVLK